MEPGTYDKKYERIESDITGTSTERKSACLNCPLSPRNVRRTLIFHLAPVLNVPAGSPEP
jgi:hypothetical protein